MLLMLEDNLDRVQRFIAALRCIDPDLQLMVWGDAQAMIRQVGNYLPDASLISLDHDLEPTEESADDLGDGLDVAKFLVSQPVILPVIIHSSNGDRSRIMSGEFELAGWQCWRVAPIGDDWVEVDWKRVVIRLLKRGLARK